VAEVIIDYNFQFVGALIILVIGIKLESWLGWLVTKAL
jgi:hypothetical protein